MPDRISATRSNFTDGCGTISCELARVAWSTLRSQKGSVSGSKHVPSCFQIRLGGAKGVVVVDPTLEGRSIFLRPSQTKFEAPGVRTLDIQSTSSRPRPMFLNRPMIVILEYLGVKNESLIHLQDMAIHDIQSSRTSFLEASKLFGHHGLGASFRLPSLLTNLKTQLGLDIRSSSTPGGLSHRLITESIRCARAYALREIKHRAHVPVPGSVTLLGVSDEWDCLDEGEIYATVFDDRTGISEPIEGTVLVTRSPQIHPGDIQYAEAVRRPELSHLKNVVVFSCR
jgi:RNA-dependent RNA polymerase